MSQVPDHHLRYARAWTLYRERRLPEECLLILEREMDSAQDEFRFDEFQVFKETLPGYLKFWEEWQAEFLADLSNKGGGDVR